MRKDKFGYPKWWVSESQHGWYNIIKGWEKNAVACIFDLTF